jgi:hypothetical protein
MTTNKKLTYKSEILALPPLKMVLGDVPDPDPSNKRRPFRPFGETSTTTDVKGTLTKLIGHLKSTDR